MPIKSYLVYPVANRAADLQRTLQAMSECEVIPSTSHDLFILVTDTPHEAAEKALEQRLLALEHLQCLALVAAYRDEE
ncbi:hypothetical protein ARMA_2541 [Ardenticatena maritima]|uniref:Transcription regulator AsnC/Lrp ligand binding domain-containing protein n=1 Tax=Ardenticatena maritima TaxID=872965 RepID=A0A0M9UDM2_9CHLR|nr:hypothetical protein [Ardenticatena maritima]KPL86434.1 hypothetical protein SE16_14155 [Ardenticatena maritima]GAP64117.1 hypothetical protein ARMA_2541 [Ardenticatena maritima]